MKIGVVDGGKNDCWTLPKPQMDAANVATRMTTVAVRLRREGDTGAVPLDAFVERARGWVSSRSLEP